MNDIIELIFTTMLVTSIFFFAFRGFYESIKDILKIFGKDENR